MSSLPSEVQERLKKLKEMSDQKINPYVDSFIRTHSCNSAKLMADKIILRDSKEIIEKKPQSDIKLCGRLRSIRGHGKLTFAHLQDFSGQIQLCFSENVLLEDKYSWLKYLDVGDFIGASGELFKTHKGENTLFVSDYQLLSKTIRPLPEKWHGLQDQETKYRERYLDLIMDESAMGRFLLRSKLIDLMRKFLTKHNFIEVETPILATKASGAVAKPFLTHHNALDIDVFLRIAPETYLKRCIAGGFDRVFEFAKCFRNEGIDPSHLQEFTMLEYYAAYWNYEINMDFTEALFEFVLKELRGDLKICCISRTGEERIIDFTRPWPRRALRDLIKENSGIDILQFESVESLRKAIKKQKIEIEHIETFGYGNLIDALYKKIVRPKLIQPIFVINHPIQTKPLARQNDQNPHLSDAFQLLVNSWEIVNAYSELVDPLDQRKRLEEQSAVKAAGDEEAMDMDEDYLLCMEHGMPPISGWGMGIDRFMALLTKQDNLKDVVLFPLMRPMEH